VARRLKWHFRLRLAKNEYIGVRRRPLQRLDTWPLKAYQPRFLQDVRLTAQRVCPLCVALVWDGDPKHDPWRIATDQPARPVSGRSRGHRGAGARVQTLTDYALRKVAQPLRAAMASRGHGHRTGVLG